VVRLFAAPFDCGSAPFTHRHELKALKAQGLNTYPIKRTT